jgi:hypothetical protein
VRVRFSEGVPDVWDALPNSEYDGRVWDNKEFTREEARQIFQVGDPPPPRMASGNESCSLLGSCARSIKEQRTMGWDVQGALR